MAVLVGPLSLHPSFADLSAEQNREPQSSEQDGQVILRSAVLSRCGTSLRWITCPSRLHG
ncbi:unnamed protein product [Haemonchus placei]|uniref:Secreted protein n=1 Tax=Haemonchus placei TaxID=6290 RepID=A0A0N4WKP2_HAEPC|nr:unnamed protein product [Haemonchus placei]